MGAMKEHFSSEQKRYKDQQKFIQEQMDKRRKLDERNEKLIEELREGKMNHVRNPQHPFILRAIVNMKTEVI